MDEATEILDTFQDHDRVMAIPSYRRWHEGRNDWCRKWEERQRIKSSNMRERAEAKYRAELERISAWEAKHCSYHAAYEAWKAADDQRYWPLRKV